MFEAVNRKLQDKELTSDQGSEKKFLFLEYFTDGFCSLFMLKTEINYFCLLFLP